MDFSGFVCEVKWIPWPVRSGKAMFSDSGGEGRNLCSDQAFHHQHLRKLYKIILASLCRKIAQRSFLGFACGASLRWAKTATDVRSEVRGIVQSAYAQYASVPCNSDAHTFLIVVGKVGSIPFTGKDSLQCLQRRTITVGAIEQSFQGLCRTSAVREFCTCNVSSRVA